MIETMVNEAVIGETARHDSDARWYVIHTHLKQEDRAESNLKVLGAQVFSPKIRERRYPRYTNLPVYATKCLFPRYIFAQFRLDDLYCKVRFTRGVHNVIGFGDGPTPIDEGVIALIRSRIGEEGLVEIGEDFRLGDRVIVKDGPLKDFAGIFVREMKDTDRIRVLLQTVSYQAHIEIKRDLVRRIC